MTEPAPQIVKSYLAELERALGGVPDEVAREIFAGIVEELSGLDASAAAARIEDLGDPAFIAAEARAEAGIAPAPGPGASVPTASGDPRWYTVLASLLVALGGVVIPVLGWVMGLAMVWLSKTWRLWEKWVATLTGPVGVAVAIVGSRLFVVGTSDPEAGEAVSNPLIALRPDGLLSSIVLLVVLNAVVGIWLLWRALRRVPARTS
jgi:Predicted membrane protein